MQRAYGYRSVLLFATLVALLLPFPWQLFSFQQHLLPHWFGAELYRSDSGAQLRLYGVLALLGLAAGALMGRRSTERVAQGTALLRALLTAYLAAVLARYGADKLFKTQFYLPEPTTLYTPFGALEKDTLYWSTLGLSRPYNLFLGGTEVLAALLLLFRRTRRAGLLLALSVFIQVLAVDLCFGIGVRLFSGFLLLLAIMLLAPDAASWLRFLQGKAVAARGDDPETGAGAACRWRPFAKGIVLLLVVAEALWPALRRGNWNDDAAARPPLHGAYAVELQLPEAQGGLPPARRLLLHRAGYLVLQDSNERLQPYPMLLDTALHRLRLQRGGSWQSYDYRYADSTLELFTGRNATLLLRAQALNWRALPALR